MKSSDKYFLIAALAVFLSLIFLIVFSKHGLIDYKKFKDQEKAVLQEAEKMTIKNKTLEERVYKLKTDPEYIKHVAKHEYDMAERDEIVFKDESQNKK